MDKNLFKELQDIGFKNIDDIKIFEKEQLDVSPEIIEVDYDSLLYDRTVICPVCGSEFKTPTVKSSSYKSMGRHSDFYIDYNLINPYFYDVWLCNSCGYAALKSDFDRLSETERMLILKDITSQWRGREYPRIRNVNNAIERYKLALFNYISRNSKNSTKAITCLKIAWMYRLISSDSARELENGFLKESLDGFKEAYYNESFPIYNMDKFAVMYLIGEINHRIGNLDESLIWFSNVITAPNVKSSLKELARDQKDSVKIRQKKLALDTPVPEDPEHKETPTIEKKRKGLFSNFFGK